MLHMRLPRKIWVLNGSNRTIKWEILFLNGFKSDFQVIFDIWDYEETFDSSITWECHVNDLELKYHIKPSSKPFDTQNITSYVVPSDMKFYEIYPATLIHSSAIAICSVNISLLLFLYLHTQSTLFFYIYIYIFGYCIVLYSHTIFKRALCVCIYLFIFFFCLFPPDSPFDLFSLVPFRGEWFRKRPVFQFSSRSVVWLLFLQTTQIWTMRPQRGSAGL